MKMQKSRSFGPRIIPRGRAWIYAIDFLPFSRMNVPPVVRPPTARLQPILAVHHFWRYATARFCWPREKRRWRERRLH